MPVYAVMVTAASNTTMSPKPRNSLARVERSRTISSGVPPVAVSAGCEPSTHLFVHHDSGLANHRLQVEHRDHFSCHAQEPRLPIVGEGHGGRRHVAQFHKSRPCDVVGEDGEPHASRLRRHEPGALGNSLTREAKQPSEIEDRKDSPTVVHHAKDKGRRAGERGDFSQRDHVLYVRGVDGVSLSCERKHQELQRLGEGLALLQSPGKRLRSLLQDTLNLFAWKVTRRPFDLAHRPNSRYARAISRSGPAERPSVPGTTSSRGRALRRPTAVSMERCPRRSSPCRSRRLPSRKCAGAESESR